MIVFPSNSSKFTATFQGDASTLYDGNLYTLSRSMLRVKREDTATMSLVLIYTTSGGVNFGCTYYTDPDGVLEIPLKNVVNLVKDAGSSLMLLNVVLKDIDETVVDTLSKNFSLNAGISYYDLNAPRNKDCDQFFAAYSNRYVLPPNVILNPQQLSGLTAPGVIVESNFHEAPGTVTWEQGAGGSFTTVTPSGDRSNQLVIGNTANVLRVTQVNGGQTYTKEWQLEKADYCSNLVCVRWTSMTGAVRQHFFPVVAHLRGDDKATSLVTPGDGYDVRKNATFGVRCRLTGLTAYGFWYYMDLAQASDVHAIILQTTANWATEIASAQTAAYVTDAPTETPTGNGFYNFDFTLKLRHYDTL